MSLSENLEEKEKLPSLKHMALELAGTAKDVLNKAILSGVVLASNETINKRWDICYDCEHLLKEPVSEIIPYRCKLCGCGMKMKVRFAASQCPIKKWGAT